MKIKALPVIAILLSSTPAFAQNNQQDAKPAVYNYVIDDPMDHFSTVVDTTVQLKYFPEFYSPTPRKHKDTTFTFECYDARDSILHRVKENSQIRFISLFKSYKDPIHTYTDDKGIKKPLPVSSIVKRYDRVGDDKWLTVDYSNNKVSELKEYRNQIVGSDSVIVVDPTTSKNLVTIYSYYKVEKVK